MIKEDGVTPDRIKLVKNFLRAMQTEGEAKLIPITPNGVEKRKAQIVVGGLGIETRKQGPLAEILARAIARRRLMGASYSASYQLSLVRTNQNNMPKAGLSG